MRKTKLDDGFHSYLVKDADLVGDAGIPRMIDLHNTSTPKSLIPFEKCKYTKNYHQYIHFYMHDKFFAKILTDAEKYVALFQLFDGIITPDFSMLRKQSKCLQETNTYFNRAVGVFFQKHGIPVIPNIRWSDESSFEYCFLGVPKHIPVADSTHGCIRSKADKDIFKLGLSKMLDVLEPSEVIVHGFMPDYIFGEFLEQIPFHRYPSLFEAKHEGR